MSFGYDLQMATVLQPWQILVAALELRRMTASTRMPDRLRELFAAVGNDPMLIQETLVRATFRKQRA